MQDARSFAFVIALQLARDLGISLNIEEMLKAANPGGEFSYLQISISTLLKDAHRQGCVIVIVTVRLFEQRSLSFR